MLSNTGFSIKQLSFYNQTNLKKTKYNKAIAKCTYCNKSYHAIENYLFLHLKKQKLVDYFVIQLKILNNASIF